MALTQPASGPNPARTARRRIAVMSLVIFAAITAACALAIAAAGARAARVDLTATRNFTLAERTRRVLNGLDGAYEIVVVASAATVGGDAQRRIDDLLDEMAHASANLRWTRIDPSSAGDSSALRSLLNRLAQRDAAKLSAQRTLAEGAIATARELAKSLQSLAQGLANLRAALSPGDSNMEALRNQENVLRLYAEQADGAATRAEALLDEGAAGSTLPPLDAAAAALKETIAALPAQLDALGKALAALYPPAGGATPDAARDAARPAIAAANSARDQAASVSDAAERVGDVDALRVARLLERENAVVVIGPRRSTAVAFHALFPTTAMVASLQATEAEVRFAGEELLAAALAAQSAKARPIVVFVHAAPARQFDDRGKPASAQAKQALGALVDRLSLHSIPVREWAAALDPDPPALPASDDLGASLRPVWVIIPTPVGSMESAENMSKLASAEETLFARGEPMLVSALQSRLPGVGEPDPQTAYLEPIGVRIDTGKALLERARGASGVAVNPQHVFRQAERSQPIGAAINGQNVLLAWMSPIRFDAAKGSDAVRFEPILTLPDDPDRWAEAQWESFRAAGAQRASGAALPEPNPSVDDTKGPWVVAAGIERRLPERRAPQRIVVVGAHQWFFDPFTQLSAEVDGRRVTVAPGNMELFEAAAHWLAGLDEMIAPASLSRDVPRIRPISAGVLTMIRWGVAAGLPILLLLAGFALRALRP